jgi:hypothetical protein
MVAITFSLRLIKISTSKATHIVEYIESTKRAYTALLAQTYFLSTTAMDHNIDVASSSEADSLTKVDSMTMWHHTLQAAS